MLALKSGKLAEIIYDILGPQKTGQLLAKILAGHTGTTYTQADVIADGLKIKPVVGQIIEDWFANKGFAGFSTDQVQLYQLSENESGEPQYQLKLRIKNEESVVGFVRVAWINEVDGARAYSDVIRVPGESGILFGLVLSKPPIDVHIEPYLSLNREEFLVEILIPTISLGKICRLLMVCVSFL